MKLITLVAILAYIVSMFRPLLPIFDYYLNYDYIVEILCVNRDKPEMHCDGKCYLNEQFKQANNDSKQPKNLILLLSNKFSERLPVAFSQEFVQYPEIKAFTTYIPSGVTNFISSPDVPPPEYF